MRLVMPPAYGGIKRYRDPSLCPSICLSHGAAALGYRHSGCLQLSHDCRPWTGVDPPRVELPSAGAYHLPAPGTITCCYYYNMNCLLVMTVSCSEMAEPIQMLFA